MIKQFREQGKDVDALLDSNLTGHRKEFVLTAVQEEANQKIEGLLKPEVTDRVAREMALKKVRESIAEYKEIQRTLQSSQQIKTEVDVYQQDPYYHSPLTNSDQSDFERMAGQRMPRLTLGDEIYQTGESIRNTETLKLLKRNYFRNKRLHFLPPAQEEHKLDMAPQTLDENITREAYSLGEDGTTRFSFEELCDRITYFLKEAPTYIQQVSHNPRECSEKPFYPQIVQLDLQHRQLLWDSFSDNFGMLFPTHNRSPTKDPATLTKEEKNLIRKEEAFSVELYKEFSQPNNREFFTHFLANDLKIFNAQNENTLQRLMEGRLGHTMNEDLRKLQAFPDPDLPESDEEESEDDEPIQMQQVDEVDIMQQYLDAKNEAYYGRGKRKSCRTSVKITKGYGLVTINDKLIHDYYLVPYYRALALLPLTFTSLACYIDVHFHVRGSGSNSQAEAMCNALARALVSMCPGLKQSFRKLNLTRTDRRKVECKKPGLLKARKSPPYNRR